VVDIPVSLGARAYTVRLAATFDGADAALAPWTSGRPVALVADARVAERWADRVRAPLRARASQYREILVPAGEAAKCWSVAEGVLDDLLAPGFDRQGVVVALGGGSTSDLAGFCAAIALRGVAYVTLPTTLLGLVDAAVGGKTALDHRRGKNLIGAFHQPSAVFGALEALSTLPEAEWRSGLGEVVKTALLAGDPLWSSVRDGAAALRDRDLAVTASVAAACVQHKAAVVAADERETGLRATLNLGHTLGHALEHAFAPDLPHGVAVAHGLVLESLLSERLGLATPGLSQEIADVLGSVGIDPQPPVGRLDAVRRALAVDKKADGDRIAVPLLIRPGQVERVLLSVSALADAAEGSA
jgi:3-dehydroquinate synthase